MTSNRLFLIFAACSWLLGYATLSAAQGIPTAVEQAAKDMLSFPLNGIALRVYQKDLSYKEFVSTNADVIVPYLNTTKQILIHVHGYAQSTDNPFVYNLIKGLKNGYDYNVIAVDYRYVTYNFYPSSVILANAVAGVLLNAVETLVNNGVPQEKFILSGFSLGAQIVAKVARYASFRIEEILAMDPAGPMFNIFDTSVSKTDAKCVKCIHTDINMYGNSNPCGHLDFYPNGGYRDQPGCSFLSSMGACSHEKATELTAEAAINPHGFPSIKCDSWTEFKNGNCNSSAIIPFGLNAPCNASGKFYFQSNPQQPYARNLDGTNYDASLDKHLFGSKEKE